MRWPIRHQILLPFAAVVLLAVTALTIVAVTLAVRRSERQTLIQLQNTIDTLSQTNVNYTVPVLLKIRGFSGAHLVACDESGAVIASTLPEATQLPAGISTAPTRRDLSSLAALPTVALGDARYFVARLQPRGDREIRALYIFYPVERWSRVQWDAAVLPVMVGGPALALTSVVALWLAHRFSRRLGRLQAQVASIAAGDFLEIADDGRRDEIQELVISVNQMAAQLRGLRGSIADAERTRLLAQLAGGLAHQLRNGVAGARLALQLHQRRCPSVSADTSLDVALRQLSLTETQVRGLLSLGRAEIREATWCDVGELLAEIEPLLRPTCEHAGVVLSTRFPTVDSTGVVVEVEGLRAAILNLGLNAIEAAGRRGSVSMEARRDGLFVTIDVCDTGPGPPPDIADSLFDPFVTGKPEGVGLGLSLARRIAVEYGGSLAWLRESGRTIFRLTLPAVDPTGGEKRKAESGKREQLLKSEI
ncbi:MAG: HAMP domain-containing histidine kinase [Planctomycetaceae bacterium]|nr:HAMP domain-containing histidine kinase [Planctomycetaceae bacterium]